MIVTIPKLYDVFLSSTGVQTDTRSLKKGELFFALKGANFDGNQYAEQAIENGALAAVVDDPSLEGKANCYLVTDGLESLQALATYHRQQFRIPFLAITGSNGKTTTKELLAAVLSKKYNVLATKGNLNNHIGVPLTLLNVTKEHDIALIEMGANHQGEIASYCAWALPNYGLINNCGKAHLEGFGGIAGVRKGKGELYDFIRKQEGKIFRNADYDYLKEMADGIQNQITYGEFAGDVRGKIVAHEPFLKIANITSGQEQLIDTHLVGDYNLPNLLAALAVGHYFEVAPHDIKEALAAYRPDNNRSEHRMVRGINVILDAYNANPTSVKAALDSFGKIDQINKIFMLGAMMELGEESAAEHKDVLAYAQQKNIKQIITVGAEFEDAAKEKNILHFAHAADAKDWFWKNINETHWVYIKGSRKTAMEQIIAE